MGKGKFREDDISDVTFVDAVAPTGISLKNRTKRELLFNLPHATYCGVGACACATETRTIEEYSHRNQEHIGKVVERKICSSISWLAGETKAVDPRTLNVGDISAAMRHAELVKV